MIPHLHRTLANLESLAMTVLPHGGQRSARRNAWAAMSEDNLRAKARRDADAAMAYAVTRATARALHPAAQAR